MKVDAACPEPRDTHSSRHAHPPRVGANGGPPSPAARSASDRETPDVAITGDLPNAEDLAVWAALCAPPTEPDADGDGLGASGSAAMPGDPLFAETPVPEMQQLSDELGALVGAGVDSGLDSCSFEVDVPGLGRLQGRMTLRRDRADLELRALTPGLAHALRTTRGALQRGVDQAVDGDVNLFIA